MILSGKTGSFNGQSFAKWEMEIKAKMVPVPNFNSGGYEQYVVGMIGAKGSASGPYDQGNMPYTVGGTGTFTFGLNVGVSLSFPGIVESVKITEDVEGSPQVNISFQSSGTLTPSIQ